MDIDLRCNESLAPYTTLKVGGEAEYFLCAKTESQLEDAVLYAQNNNMPITIIGGGSNILVADTGVPGLVVQLSLTGVTYTESDSHIFVKAAAGEMLDYVVSFCVEKGWWGLENLSHIPGTVGATPIQNVGAYGVEVADVISSVRVYDQETKTFLSLLPEDCAFGYRDSVFKHPAGSNYIVTEVTYKLQKSANPQIHYKDLASEFSPETNDLSAIREKIISIRSAKFPNWQETGTAGSFFKNPIIKKDEYKEIISKYPDLPSFSVDSEHVKIPLGYVLDKILNLKGEKVGYVGNYKNQALVLVAEKGATATAVTDYADSLKSRVSKELNIDIEWEVTRIPKLQ